MTKILCPGCHLREFDWEPNSGVFACPGCQADIERQSRAFARGAEKNFNKIEARAAKISKKKFKKQAKKNRHKAQDVQS